MDKKFYQKGYKYHRAEVVCGICGEKRFVCQTMLRKDKAKIYRCRKCRHIQDRKNGVFSLNNKKYKKCRKCDEIKEISFFDRRNYKHVASQSPYCKKCVSLQNKKYRKKHRNKLNRANKAYYRKNKKILLKKNRKYLRNRLKIDQIFYLRKIISRRIASAIRLAGTRKKQKSVALLGCSYRDAREYIESKWKSGMSWDNHGSGRGKWQIDHIVPCMSFNLKLESEQKKCFHYANLQPLWYEDHLKKTAKDIETITKAKNNV